MKLDLNQPILNSNQKDLLGDSFASCFDLEIGKLSLNDEQYKKVFQFSLDIFLRVKLHTLFTLESLNKTVEYVFQDEIVRDFILCLSDRLGFQVGLLGVRDFSIERTLAFGIGKLTTDQEPRADHIFIPERISNSIEVDSETIYSILLNNKWLTTIVLIHLFLYKTAVFSGAEQLDNLNKILAAVQTVKTA